MRRLRRLILGSARVSRVWRWRPRHRELSNVIHEHRVQRRGKVRDRETRSPAREDACAPQSFAFALWGRLRPCAVVVVLAFVWWLPIPNELQKSPSGTLTLLDCRGREIAELASSEARTQFPVALEHMGPWLPRLTVALEDRRFYEHRGVDWRATIAASARNLRSRQYCFGRIHDHPATRETREQP